ncbi:fimbria/pilus outer membrane usher protein, partial [Enterobacter roggenkampii]|uniref:fimbria/pilus outer membrane usher protein n=1 Tax=Enterobacter roggenkampii TaxID=1812935 RepID=UPI001F0C1E5B
MLGTSDNPSAGVGGGKVRVSVGAISVEVTNARAGFEEVDESGKSYRFLYSKRFYENNTTFRLV